MRKEFSFPDVDKVNWFIGHMVKGIRKATRKLERCDCVIELRDARIPFSGQNPKFTEMRRKRPKILVLNKMDLADPAQMSEMHAALTAQGEQEVLYADSRVQRHDSIRMIMQTIKKLVRPPQNEDEFIKLLILGMPNVGKSSFINAFRRTFLKKGKAAAVGAIPGITRSVQSDIKVSENPRMYVVDTPGIMVPNIPNIEVALKLATTGILRDKLLSEDIIADYILFILNSNQKFRYTKYYEIPEPSDDVDEVMEHVARKLHAFVKGGKLDYLKAMIHFIKKFRSGELGRVTLDKTSLALENKD